MLSVQPGLLRTRQPWAGPKDYSQKVLLGAGYPGQPSQSHYRVDEVEPSQYFADMQWDWTSLTEARAGASTGLPFAISLQRLLAPAAGRP